MSQGWDVISWQRNISISSLRELKNNGFSFLEKTTVLHLLGTKGGKGTKGLGVVLQVGLIVPSIKMQHRQISLGGDDNFLCLKYGLLTARRDTGCAFPWKMNLCTQERQLQSIPASAAYEEFRKCLVPAETENLGSWAEHHCCVFFL